jgi:hypothetical protein
MIFFFSGAPVEPYFFRACSARYCAAGCPFFILQFSRGTVFLVSFVFPLSSVFFQTSAGADSERRRE